MLPMSNHVIKVLLRRSCVQMSWIAAPPVSTEVVNLRSIWIALKEPVRKAMSCLNLAVPEELSVARTADT